MNAELDVLIPTCSRPSALAATLAALFGQDFKTFRVIISDESDDASTYASPEAATAINALHLHGHEVEVLRNMSRRGLAHQRRTSLDHGRTRMSLFLDDDIPLESDMLGRMSKALRLTQCGFIECAPLGAPYVEDVRPHEQAVEFCDGPVLPECITPDQSARSRHLLHSAVNQLQVQRAIGASDFKPELYKAARNVACALYDATKLRDADGCSFWRELPEAHRGEDVVAPLRDMTRYRGAGQMPSGAWHQELPTTVSDRRVDARHVLKTCDSRSGDAACLDELLSSHG